MNTASKSIVKAAAAAAIIGSGIALAGPAMAATTTQDAASVAASDGQTLYHFELANNTGQTLYATSHNGHHLDFDSADGKHTSDPKNVAVQPGTTDFYLGLNRDYDAEGDALVNDSHMTLVLTNSAGEPVDSINVQVRVTTDQGGSETSSVILTEKNAAGIVTDTVTSPTLNMGNWSGSEDGFFDPSQPISVG